VNKLTQQQIDEELQAHGDWAQTGESLQRTYEFANFVASMAFVNRVAGLAESMQHHPDIMVRYNKVTLTTSTHDAGGITPKDFKLIEAIDNSSD